MSEIAEQLSCQELVELVTDYLDGVLPPAERVRFDAHIADCDGCRAYLEQIRATIALTGTLAPEQLAPEAEAGLLEAFRDWKRRP
jgi:anti-sigma factor RsiW